MIRYALKCRQGHIFESWFQSASAFDALMKAGHIACVDCGSADVSKALMTPGVQVTAPERSQKVAQPDKDTEIAKLRKKVEENATYVGGDFAAKAREMHDGLASPTAIYGEASGAEARALLQDGVPVLPLPFRPKRKLQ